MNPKDNIKISGEQQLRLLQVAVERSANTIVITNKDNEIVYVNKKFSELTGYLKQEVIGQNPRILKSDVQSKEYYREMWKKLNAGKSWKGEFCNIKKNGDFYWESATITPIMGEQGEIVNYIAVKEDVTARRKAENALVASEARWNFALEGSGDGVWDWNLLTNEVFFSKQWKKMLGYNEDEITNDLEEWKSKVHPEDIDECLNDIQRHLQGIDEIYVNEHRMRHKDGRYLWILDRGKVVEYDEDGNPIRLIGTHSNITQRKQNEQELKELNATKDKLFSIIGHDLINPFGNILNLAEILLTDFEDRSPDKVKEGIEMINTAGKRAFELLSNLLEWARVQRGAIKVNKDMYLVSGIVSDAFYLLESIARNKNIQLVNEVPPDCYMYVDDLMMNTVIRNLVSNALKFTPESGKVIISAKQKGEFTTIEIKDTGVGIEKERLDNLFSIKSNESTKGTEGEPGTGLGLILSQEFVNNNNGVLNVESTIGEGTTFRIVLPAKENKKE